jgi:hypothetical protein
MLRSRPLIFIMVAVLINSMVMISIVVGTAAKAVTVMTLLFFSSKYLLARCFIKMITGIEKKSDYTAFTMCVHGISH